MARTLLTVLPAILFLAVGASSAQPQALGREQARQALASADEQMRRQAASRLGEVGMRADTAALRQALRDADGDTRARAEQAMWSIWSRSGDHEIDRLYRTGVEQMSGGDLRNGIATFSRIIQRKPEFAEGWNKRATLYFLTGEYRKSLADCNQVIKRNPHHFGALAGYGQIYIKLEDYQRSLEYFQKALEVNPNMESVRLNILMLERLIERRRKNMI